ncbi:MAG: DeoR/GlpR transcriptional regulator [Tissierella sp.]|nr:DeoR/GlpR transcriptional regulator [Tissierella sp.]
MFAIERIRIIKNYLLEKNKVSVNELSKMLDVSEVTIRRDLEKLEEEGMLIRTHGGAVLKKQTNPSNSNNMKTKSTDSTSPYSDLYEEIADIAIHIIENGDVIMLANGIINYHIAKKLDQKKNVTVLTNDLLVSIEASSSSSNKAVLLGGDVDYETKATFGALTAMDIQKFYVNKVFIEVDGIDVDTGISVSTIDKANLINSILPNSKEKIILCLGSNFNKTAFYNISRLDIAEKIVTNSNIDNSYKEYLSQLGIQLYTSINAVERGNI